MEALIPWSRRSFPVIALLAVLGGVYKFVLAKPAKAESPSRKVHGMVYMLQKEFLVNLADGRFAKLQVGLVLAHDDTSTVGRPVATAPLRRPPEGYGAMAQEGIVRDVITGVLTDATDKELIETARAARSSRKRSSRTSRSRPM